MKSIIKYLGIVSIVIATISCRKDDNTIAVPDSVEETPQPEEDTPDVEEETPAPTLGEVSPLNGPKTTIVTINGEHFGTDTTKLKVLFNEREAEVQQLTDSKIVAMVPARAYTGPIKIVVRDVELTGPEFTYQIVENIVSTLAGSGVGSSEGTGTEAKFNRPTGIALDVDGNAFVADPLNNRIRKITPEGIVTTFAGGTKGSADGIGTDAQFDAPWDVDIDGQGNIYVADAENHRIRKIDPNGNVLTLAGSDKGNSDGRGAEAKFDAPRGIAVTPDGIVYVADTNNDSVKKIDQEGNVRSFPGGFGTITGIAVDQEGLVYIVSASGHSIWKLDYENSQSDYVAGNNGEGDEDGSPSKFRFPKDIVVDHEGNLYVADEGNNKIRKITTDNQVETYAGGTFGSNDGSGINAQFKLPYGLAIGSGGTLYVADTGNHRIRKIIQE